MVFSAVCIDSLPFFFSGREFFFVYDEILNKYLHINTILLIWNTCVWNLKNDWISVLIQFPALDKAKKI